MVKQTPLSLSQHSPQAGCCRWRGCRAGRRRRRSRTWGKRGASSPGTRPEPSHTAPAGPADCPAAHTAWAGWWTPPRSSSAPRPSRSPGDRQPSKRGLHFRMCSVMVSTYCTIPSRQSSKRGLHFRMCSVMLSTYFTIPSRQSSKRGLHFRMCSVVVSTNFACLGDSHVNEDTSISKIVF